MKNAQWKAAAEALFADLKQAIANNSVEGDVDSERVYCAHMINQGVKPEACDFAGFMTNMCGGEDGLTVQACYDQIAYANDDGSVQPKAEDIKFAIETERGYWAGDNTASRYTDDIAKADTFNWAERDNVLHDAMGEICDFAGQWFKVVCVDNGR